MYPGDFISKMGKLSSQSHFGKSHHSVRHTVTAWSTAQVGEAEWVVLALLGQTAAPQPTIPVSSLESHLSRALSNIAFFPPGVKITQFQSCFQTVSKMNYD